MSDKERDSIQEMEDIQKGLEAFLQQEMQDDILWKAPQSSAAHAN